MPTREIVVKPSIPEAGSFVGRHIGPRAEDIRRMLKTIGYPSLDALIDAAVPKSIRSSQPTSGWPAQEEAQALAEIKALANRNSIWRSYLGMGYYDCATPAPIQRNILENPGWYTPY